jgi:hypothetical protein
MKPIAYNVVDMKSMGVSLLLALGTGLLFLMRHGIASTSLFAQVATICMPRRNALHTFFQRSST